MHTKTVLSHEEVQAILAVSVAEATRQGWAVSVCIADDGGHPLAFARLDGASAISGQIATEKARAAAMGRRETKHYEDLINNGRFAFLGAGIPGALEGGVPIVLNGTVVGAIGVSGVKSEQDAVVAKAGAASVL